MVDMHSIASRISRFHFLFAALLAAAAHGADFVRDSWSPRHQWRIAVETNDDGARYRVVTRSHHFLKSSFRSDYWTADQCVGSGVYWRRDSAYFVIEEISSGIHQEFAVARRTPHGFEDMEFDRNTVMEPTHVSWHHASVHFDRWLPHNRMAVTIAGDLDGFKGDFACKLILDLKHEFRVKSWRLTKPPARE